MDKTSKQIWNLAIPSIISNITTPLLGLVDIAIVGHLDSTSLIGAVAVSSMTFNMIYWIFGFLRMGTSGMTAQALGKKQFGEVLQILVHAFTIAMAIALGLILLQIGIFKLAFYFMKPSQEIVYYSSIYLKICIWGTPAMLGLYAFTGWLIGMQNTRLPMIISILQNIINIIASTIFVFFFKMSIAGVALGTLIAQWFAFFFMVIGFLKYYHRLFTYDWKTGLFRASAMNKFFHVNKDIFIRTLFLVAVNLFFVSAGTQQGDIILAVNTLLMTFFTIFSYISDGFAYAGEALSGKYYGAKNEQMFHRLHGLLIKWGFLFACLFSLFYYLGGDLFLSLLTDKAEVISASHDYFLWAVFIPIAGIVAFIYDGIFIGLTETRGMLISSIISTCIFFITYLLLNPLLHNHALWLAMILYLLFRGIIQMFIINKKQKELWK